MDDEATLFLNGPDGGGGFAGDGIDWVIINHDGDELIGGLWLYGVQMPDGTYDNSEDWLGGIGTLTVLSPSTVLVGDADGDGDVDAADYIMVKTHFGGEPAAGTAGTGGDFNLNGTVDWDDLQTLMTGYNAGAGADTIPEPATLFIMLAAGLPALLKRRKS